MIALAQHHGLPTQLLDWTLRSYIAAFFAAYDVIKSSKRTGNFAVWVLEPSLMCPKEQFRVVALPSGVNKNIAAQHGVFTRLKAIFSTKNRTSPVECLAEYLSKNNSTLLRKFCLPKTHAATILDYCESFGITAATIQPSYYGATDYALTHLSKHVFNKNRSRKKSSMK